MCDVPVFFATTDGHTQRIAEFLAAALRQQGLASEAIDLSLPTAHKLDCGGARAIVVAASVHAGTHQRAAADFVRGHLTALATRPSLFVSVCLSICSKRPEDVAAARALAQSFPDRLGWQPSRVACVGGRLAYTQYGFLKRWLMRQIAAKSGGPTDTSRDYDMTDWQEVRARAAAVASRVRAPETVTSA